MISKDVKEIVYVRTIREHKIGSLSDNFQLVQGLVKGFALIKSIKIERGL